MISYLSILVQLVVQFFKADIHISLYDPKLIFWSR
jgi:hypothetical protein